MLIWNLLENDANPTRQLCSKVPQRQRPKFLLDYSGESKEEELVKRRKVDARRDPLMSKTNEQSHQGTGKNLEEKKKLDILEKSSNRWRALAKHHDAERLKGFLNLYRQRRVQENLEEIDEHLNNTGLDASLKEKSPTKSNNFGCDFKHCQKVQEVIKTRRVRIKSLNL